MNESPRKPGSFDGTQPKMTFVFGLVTGLAIISFIGFAILLVDKAYDNGGTPVVQSPVVAAPTPTAAVAVPQGPVVGNIMPISDDEHVRGNADAEVTLIEYADLECPFCKQFHQTVDDVFDQMNGKLRVVFRHFPLRQLHSKAAREAEASECVTELGGNDAFWKFVDRLFVVTNSNNSLPDEELPKIAEFAGVNKSAFVSCLESGKYADKVAAHEADAFTAGAGGTPYSVIVTNDGEKIPLEGALPASNLKQIFDQIIGS